MMVPVFLVVLQVNVPHDREACEKRNGMCFVKGVSCNKEFRQIMITLGMFGAGGM